MNNLIKSGKLFLFLSAVLFFIDSIIVVAGLGVSPYWLLHGIAAMILSVAMFVLAFFSKKHIAVDIVFIILAFIAVFIIARVATNFEKIDNVRPFALSAGILCFVEGALSILGVVFAIIYIKNGCVDSESKSYLSGGGFKRFLSKVGNAIGEFFATIGREIRNLFVRKKRPSADYGFLKHSRPSDKIKELLDSNLFRTIFAVVLAVGSIIYCAVSLSMHFVWLDILTGIPIALVLATVGNVLLTVKNEYLSDIDEYEGVSKNILALLLIILYHLFFALATLASFFVFNHYAQAENGKISPFLVALNLSFGVFAIAQPFIYDRLEDNDKEWLTVFGFPLFYAGLYIVNIGICCLDTYAINSNLIISRIVTGIVCGVTLILGIIRIIISIKNILLSTGRIIVNKMTPQAKKEQRKIEQDFINRERDENRPFFKCAQRLRAEFSNVAHELIEIATDVSVGTNEHKSYGSDFDDLRVVVVVQLTRHLPNYLSSSKKKELTKEYHSGLYERMAQLVPDIKAETGYNGKVSFELIVK